ncbi:MAG: hypothetical protein PHV33_07055 [Elusimicrobiales bacterium]|nr:hypothetical protein [Elusimicrobiales bacterium]
MVKKIILIALALLPISSVAFAAQSALTSNQEQVSGGVDTASDVSWSNGNNDNK